MADIAALYELCIPRNVKLPHILTLEDGTRTAWFVPDATCTTWVSCLTVLNANGMLLWHEAAAQDLLFGYPPSPVNDPPPAGCHPKGWMGGGRRKLKRENQYILQ